jgi:hypothetical protein
MNFGEHEAAFRTGAEMEADLRRVAIATRKRAVLGTSQILFCRP